MHKTSILRMLIYTNYARDQRSKVLNQMWPKFQDEIEIEDDEIKGQTENQARKVRKAKKIQGGAEIEEATLRKYQIRNDKAKQQQQMIQLKTQQLLNKYTKWIISNNKNNLLSNQKLKNVMQITIHLGCQLCQSDVIYEINDHNGYLIGIQVAFQNLLKTIQYHFKNSKMYHFRRLD